MKEKKDCKIVQDLLPNYIEKLTNEESNKFVEEHLESCKECKKVLENMKKDLDTNNTKSDKKEVNYIKKYNKKLRTLKIVLLIILTVFVIRTGRNMIIISSMEDKADTHIKSNNYYRKSTSYSGDDLTKIDYYYKDGKSITVLQRLSEKYKDKITVYNSGKGIYNMYFETEQGKSVKLNEKGEILGTNIINYFESHNFFTFISRSILSNIRSVKCNGKDCYLVNDFILRDAGTYIDKETGLIIRTNNGVYNNDSTGNVTNGLMDVRYEFGTITDDMFIEPDISEYEIQK